TTSAGRAAVADRAEARADSPGARRTTDEGHHEGNGRPHMLTAGEVAGLIVALFWAILTCFLAMVLVKLARLLTETTKMVSELSDRVLPLRSEERRVGKERRARWSLG